MIFFLLGKWGEGVGERGYIMFKSDSTEYEWHKSDDCSELGTGVIPICLPVLSTVLGTLPSGCRSRIRSEVLIQGLIQK